MRDIPAIWEKAFEVNAGQHPALRASCVEFVLAGLYSMDRISRSQKHGKVRYEF
jgi:magnesium chelatase subunit I